MGLSFKAHYVEQTQIDEIFDFEYKSKRDVEKYLKSQKMEKIGSGTEASVWKTGNKAIRVGKAGKSPCWADFAKIAMKTKNRHYPKIYRLKEWKKYVVAEMELLSDFSDKGGYKNLGDMVIHGLFMTYDLYIGMDYIRKGFRPNLFQHFRQKYTDDQAAKGLKMELDDVNVLLAGNYGTDDYLKKFASHPFIKAMKPFMSYSGCILGSCIPGNVMYRGKTLVLIDPLF